MNGKALLLKLVRNKKNSQINVSLPKRELEKWGDKIDRAKILKIKEWEFE